MSAGAARGGTILLIEDEEDIATLVRTYLEKDGFRVIWAARGVEGLQELERNDIRLAILDLQLPDADGLDLCRAIRDRSRLPIVILTARDEEIDRIIGLVMSREQLLERVWGLSFPGGTRTVDVHVAQLRRKLDRPDLIRTVRGSGYKAASAAASNVPRGSRD